MTNLAIWSQQQIRDEYVPTEFGVYLCEYLQYSPWAMMAFLDDVYDFVYWYQQFYDVRFLLTDTNASILLEYKSYLENVDYIITAWTINTRLFAIGVYLNWYAKNKLEQVSIANWDPYHQWFDKVPIPGMRRPRCLSKDEQSCLNSIIQEHLQNSSQLHQQDFTSRRDALIVLFMLNSGLSFDRLCQLRWNDFGIVDHTIHIHYRRNENTYTKLNDIAYGAMCDWMNACPWANIDSGLFIWVMENRSFLSCWDELSHICEVLINAIHNIGNDANIENLSPGTLANIFYLDCINRGMDIINIATLMNSSPRAIRAIYVNPEKLTLQDCVAVILDS